MYGFAVLHQRHTGWKHCARRRVSTSFWSAAIQTFCNLLFAALLVTLPSSRASVANLFPAALLPRRLGRLSKFLLGRGEKLIGLIAAQRHVPKGIEDVPVPAYLLCTTD
jgi:hypothetical protein